MGVSFEDLVSTTREGLNIAEDYLKRRGWKESAGTRAYVQALRHAVMSLYEVSDIVVGESFLARDLVRGGEPVQVFERRQPAPFAMGSERGAHRQRPRPTRSRAGSCLARPFGR